jgi:phenylacetate-CoA ligase
VRTLGRALRGTVYRAHWELRSRLSSFGLTEAIGFLAESERWDRPRLEDLRDLKLRRVVTHAYAQSPYYRKLMDDRGITPAQIRGLADLPKLPVLTKEMLREHRDELRCRDFPDGTVELGATGGTTGAPMKVWRDRDCTVWQRACYWRGFSWGGFRMGEPWAQVFGGALGLAQVQPKERLKSWFAGKIFLPAFELSPQNVGAYVEAVRRSGARVLVGYASALHALAAHVERAGLSLPLTAVFPTAEVLPEPWAETMARVFGAKVLPYYGCGEVQSLAYTCPAAPRFTYHTCDEHAAIEVERADGSVGLTGEGTFLISDLDNMAMPLLRYRNGDAGRIEAPGCPCGRTLGRIVRLDGRVGDVLYTVDGVAISGLIGPHVFKTSRGVEQFQLVQRRPGQVTARIVRRPDYDAAVEEARLRTVFHKHLGAGAAVEFEYVDSIPRTGAGKVRLIVNECAPPTAA